MKKNAFLTGIVCVLLTITFASYAISAEQNFPSRDIRAICPWDAGGGADAITRTISFYAQQHLPKSIYVENITGGLTSQGIFEVMKAVPDGHTWGALTYDSVITVPRKKMIPGYDLDKLAYICNVTREGYGLIINAKSPWKNLSELIADAKKNPKKITVGLQGSMGGVSHLYLVTLEKMAGVQFRYIPYAGSAAQNEAILMGEVNVISTSIGDAYPILESKKARGLAVAEGVRNSKAPDCPTFIEEGYDIVWGSFLLLAATAPITPEHLKILEDALQKACNDPKFIAWTKEAGVEAAYMNAEETKTFVINTQKTVFGIMDDLVSQGLLKE